MLRKSIILFTQLLLLCLTANATVFVVTSNGDSGAGTLRQALLDAAANGSVTPDDIHFNIADQSEAGRTIQLITELPNLSSNLTIDGSTQSGPVFGQSNAKVKVASPRNTNPFIIFNGQGIDRIEIDGLYIYDYTGINTLRPDQKSRTGIQIFQSSNVVIGSKGKGNLIRGFNTNSIYLLTCTDISVRSNVLGLGSKNNFDSDEPGDAYDYTGPAYLLRCSNILIGGDIAEGNFVFCMVYIGFAKNTDAGTLSIKSNNIGIFQDNKSISLTYQSLVYFSIFTEEMATDAVIKEPEISAAAKVNINIENNLGGNFANVFRINAINGAISIYNNFLGISRDGVTNLNNNSKPNQGAPINIVNCPQQVVIGGDSPAKKNYLAFATVGLATFNSPKVQFQYNEFKCLTNGAYYNYEDHSNPGGLPKISIDKVSQQNSQTTVTGKADPGATVDIYSSENCDFSSCSIRAYSQTVIADNNGDWTAAIANLNGIFYASATLNKVTSEFKTLTINVSNAVVDNMRCTDYGHITGLKVPTGANFYWEDGNGLQVGNTVDLEINKPGTYRLVIVGGCIKSDWYTILDNRPKIESGNVTIVNASCSTANGSIKGLVFSDPLNRISTFGWKNSANVVVSTTVDAVNLSPGAYTFSFTTSDGCSRTYGPITITNTTGPNISQTSASINPTNCGQTIGSITGITATGAGTLKYSWKNEQQQQVGTSIDLLNQPAGKYTLQVTDDTQCGPVYTTVLEIPQLNGIILDESTIVITTSNCSNNNGGITGIKASGATAYKWVDANNITAGSTPDLSNVPSGNYTFTASNAFGCTQTKTYFVGQQAATVYPAYPSTVVNACNGNTNGSITIVPNTLVKSVRWTDNVDATIGTGNSLIDRAPGTYKLYFTDINGCESFYKSYSLIEDGLLMPPAVSDLQVCSPGNAVLEVNNTSAGYRYRLYESENSITPLNEQPTGRFTINVTSNTSYFVSQIKGLCESSRAQVQVTVGISKFDIANTFTPNADGINDYWKITGIESSPNATVQVFNRTGQIVFNSKGYANPFNGTANGRNLPVGNYYYIINMGSSACGVLSGTITIIR